jgi:hypothetical protein
MRITIFLTVVFSFFLLTNLSAGIFDRHTPPACTAPGCCPSVVEVPAVVVVTPPAACTATDAATATAEGRRTPLRRIGKGALKLAGKVGKAAFAPVRLLRPHRPQ